MSCLPSYILFRPANDSPFQPSGSTWAATGKVASTWAAYTWWPAAGDQATQIWGDIFLGGGPPNDMICSFSYMAKPFVNHKFFPKQCARTEGCLR